MSNGVAKVIYDTAAGKAVSIGFNRYQIIEGVNIGKIYRREQTVTGYVYIYVTTLCPVGYKSVNEGALTGGLKCIKEVITVVCPEGYGMTSGGTCVKLVNQGCPSGWHKNVSTGKCEKDIVYANGNGMPEANWFTYAAIALVAYLLFVK